MLDENPFLFISGYFMRLWFRSLAFIIVGLAAGVGLGFYIGWVAWPTEFTQADPLVLQERYRRDYTLMIASAYSQDGDLSAAQRRLANMDEIDSQAWFMRVTVDAILTGAAEDDIRQLVRLAVDLGIYSPVMEPYLPDTRSE